MKEKWLKHAQMQLLPDFAATYNWSKKYANPECMKSLSIYLGTFFACQKTTDRYQDDV